MMGSHTLRDKEEVALGEHIHSQNHYSTSLIKEVKHLNLDKIHIYPSDLNLCLISLEAAAALISANARLSYKDKIRHDFDRISCNIMAWEEWDYLQSCHIKGQPGVTLSPFADSVQLSLHPSCWR